MGGTLHPREDVADDAPGGGPAKVELSCTGGTGPGFEGAFAAEPSEAALELDLPVFDQRAGRFTLHDIRLCPGREHEGHPVVCKPPRPGTHARVPPVDDLPEPGAIPLP